MVSLKGKELIHTLMQAVRNQEHPELNPRMTDEDLFNQVVSAREKLEDYIGSIEEKVQ